MKFLNTQPRFIFFPIHCKLFINNNNYKNPHTKYFIKSEINKANFDAIFIKIKMDLLMIIIIYMKEIKELK